MLRKSATCVLFLILAANLYSQSTSKPHRAATNSDAGAACIAATSEQDGIGVHTLPGTTKKLYSYNVDAKPSKKHKAICVSQSKLDTVLWHHGDGTSCFKIEPKLLSTSNAEGGECPAYPFTRALPDTCVHTHHTEHAKKAAIGCSYDMIFHREDGSMADPHIVVGK